MSHATNTGVDISFAAVITYQDEVTFALTSTTLQPLSQYAHLPVGKHIKIEMFRERACLLYGGDAKSRVRKIGTKENRQERRWAVNISMLDQTFGR
jgi:hypothetical protein